MTVTVINPATEETIATLEEDGVEEADAGSTLTIVTRAITEPAAMMCRPAFRSWRIGSPISASATAVRLRSARRPRALAIGARLYGGILGQCQTLAKALLI